MARPVSIIELTTEESQELHRRVQASTTTQQDHLRARVVLLRAEGMKQQDVAEALGVSIVCVTSGRRDSSGRVLQGCGTNRDGGGGGRYRWRRWNR